MDAEINPALTIFLFRLGQGRKAPRHVGTNIAVMVFGHAIEFIGDESKADMIGSVEATNRLKNRSAESRVA